LRRQFLPSSFTFAQSMSDLKIQKEQTMRNNDQAHRLEPRARREEEVRFILSAWPMRAAQPQPARVVARGMRIERVVEDCTEDPERWDSLL